MNVLTLLTAIAPTSPCHSRFSSLQYTNDRSLGANLENTSVHRQKHSPQRRGGPDSQARPDDRAILQSPTQVPDEMPRTGERVENERPGERELERELRGKRQGAKGGGHGNAGHVQAQVGGDEVAEAEDVEGARGDGARDARHARRDPRRLVGVDAQVRRGRAAEALLR